MLEKVGNLPHIKPNNFGFSDTEATSNLFSEGEPSFLSSVYQRRLDHYGIDMNRTEEITLTTIDSYCAKNNIKKIDFLKMDVEGHELKILEGARKMIADGKIDYIQFEFGGCNIDSRTYLQDFFYLLKDKYDLFRIVKDGLYPIKAYKETYEIFTLVNFLACIR
jgi:FkbM family methyltransferase